MKKVIKYVKKIFKQIPNIVFKYKFDQFLLKIWVFQNQHSYIIAPKCLTVIAHYD